MTEVLDRLTAMSESDRDTPQYADALSEFVGCREELNQQLDAIVARFR